MAVVPMNRGPRLPPDPLADVSDAHKLMAIGQMYQDGSLFDPTPMNPPPPEPKPTPPEGATARSLKDWEKAMEQDLETNSRKFDENAPPNKMLQEISEKKNIESLPEMPGGGGGGGSAGGIRQIVPNPKTLETLIEFEKGLGDIQSGAMTRNQFRDLVKKRGWSVEEKGTYGMRGRRQNELSVFDPDGNEHFISW